MTVLTLHCVPSIVVLVFFYKPVYGLQYCIDVVAIETNPINQSMLTRLLMLTAMRRIQEWKETLPSGSHPTDQLVSSHAMW